MPIFNKRIVQKHIAKITEIPQAHLDVITKWIEQINSGALAKQTEVAIHAPFTQQIMVKLLGYTAFGEADSWSVSREYGVASGAVDLALGRFSADKTTDIVVAPFELKGAKTKDLDAIMSGRNKTPIQQAWDYAKDIKGAEWVLVSNYIELRLYAVSETSLIYEKFLFQDLLDPAEYAKFMLLLSPQNLLNGKTLSILRESLDAEKEISDKLYTDYKALRESMISLLIADNPNSTPESLVAPAQKLLDRVLFIAFAEDKALIPDTTIKKAFEHTDPYNAKPIYQNFIGLFNAIDQGNSTLHIPAYNGGLFAKDEYLDNLVVSDALCEGFKNLADYNFDSEVSVTVLGHIFEQSISDLEELTQAIVEGDIPKPQKKLTAVTGKRKTDGVVYTPDNITQFIVANTLGVHVDQQFEMLFSHYGKYKHDDTIQWKKGKQTELRFWYVWQDKLKTIRVVDPACGSGAFLVAAFDYLYAEYEKANNKIAELTGQRGVLDLNKEILNNNLFGVDINEESIEITKLSLWLKTAERGKPLESLDANFITGNSLGFDQPVPGATFSWQSAFKDIFVQGGFDVVLGNPPYVRQELLGEIKPWLQQNYSVYHGVLDLYGYFFELGNKLLKPDGRMAYISSSTFFKTGSGQQLRYYLSSTVSLEKIVDFGDVQIFDGVTTYPAILVLKNTPPSSGHKTAILAIKDKLPDNLLLTFEQLKGFMAQNQLGSASWQLEDESLHALRKKLTTNYLRLKETYGSPLYGIKTGCNKAFVIDRDTRDNIVQQEPEAAKIIKPFLEGKDLKRWHSQSRDLFLIAIPKFWTRAQLNKSKNELLDEEEAWDWLSKNYSALSQWLTPFAVQGRKRVDKGEFWWELRSCSYYDEFENPKIQYGHFSPNPLFHFNTNSAYSNDKSYIIPTDDLYLYGLLNSNVYWYLIKSMCPAVRGGFYEVRAQYIETLPIPNKPENEIISELARITQSTAESRYQCEKSFRRRLVDLCPQDETFKLNKKLANWWLLDFSELQKEIKNAFKGSIPVAERNAWQDYFDAEKVKRESLSNEIKALEEKLNQSVYQLFDLSGEEIAMIEEAVR